MFKWLRDLFKPKCEFCGSSNRELVLERNVFLGDYYQCIRGCEA